MKKLLVSLLAALPLILATPASPHTHEAMQAVAAQLGADVTVDEWNSDSFNAGFIPPGTYCMYGVFCQTLDRSLIVFAGDWSKVPYEVRLTVFLHELGHYRQWKDGRPMDEWDADLYAANTLCRQGRDGVYLFERAATAIVRRLGLSWGEYHGTSHGSWYERVENVRHNATACRQDAIQA
jgi:hypothetical protein